LSHVADENSRGVNVMWFTSWLPPPTVCKCARWYRSWPKK